MSEAGAAVLVVAFVFAGRPAGAAHLEPAADPGDLSLYRASRMARCAASLLIVRSPDELQAYTPTDSLKHSADNRSAYRPPYRRAWRTKHDLVGLPDNRRDAH